jgi:hypothetical protein
VAHIMKAYGWQPRLSDKFLEFIRDFVSPLRCSTGGGEYQVMLFPAAMADAQSIQVSWETFDEKEILSFRLYLSTNPSGLVCQLIYETPAIFRGHLQGSTHTFTDADVQLGISYTYWLDVLQKDGSTLAMDPTTASAGLHIYLPAIIR